MAVTMLILVARNHRGEEQQTLITEDEFEGRPEDYFVGSPSGAKVAGKIECDGDTEHLSGIYIRE